jgi:serine/threonine protein kinase
MAIDNLVGRQLDEYRIDRLLGRGGMGRVYLATDTQVHRQVAIKVMTTSSHADPDYAARFKREAQAIARLDHPRIVRLYRYGEAKGLVYMAMQYVEGSDLATVLTAYRKARDHIDLKEVGRVMQDICGALDYAHGQGVIHRDVKPSNILLDAQGRAYLADFGLARLMDVSTRGSVFGTVHYISPEQAIQSATAIPQSDLYSLGVVLYEMLTGKVPFDADVASEIVMKHLEEAPRPPRKLRSKLSAELETVALTALAKKPEDRYANGAALVADLQRALDTTLARSPSDSPTLLSRSSIAQRIREAAVKPLPPIPAVVAAPEPTPAKKAKASPAPKRSPAAPTPTPAPTNARRSSRPRRLLVYLFSAVVLIALVAAAVLLDPLGLSGDENEDRDGDGIINRRDNCAQVANPDQSDRDKNGIGDACQDSDGDGVLDLQDACPKESGLVVTNGCWPEGTITADGNVNMRAGPGTGYDVRGVLSPGESVFILGRNDVPVAAGQDDQIWLRVRPLNRANEEAWVNAILVDTTTPLAELPIIAP